MPPFKVYKVMQDINQQLYERKNTPEGFIPVYGVVITVPTGIYTNGQKEFTCDKTFDEVKEKVIALKNTEATSFKMTINSNNSITTYTSEIRANEYLRTKENSTSK